MTVFSLIIHIWKKITKKCIMNIYGDYLEIKAICLRGYENVIKGKACSNQSAVKTRRNKKMKCFLAWFVLKDVRVWILVFTFTCQNNNMYLFSFSSASLSSQVMSGSFSLLRTLEICRPDMAARAVLAIKRQTRSCLFFLNYNI